MTLLPFEVASVLPESSHFALSNGMCPKEVRIKGEGKRGEERRGELGVEKKQTMVDLVVL